jgi:hypothetical protein
LTLEDNVHQDAVKRRQGLQSLAKTSAAASHSSCHASVEAIDDEEDHVHHNAGPPKNPNSIVEATGDDLEKEIEDLVKHRKRFHPQSEASAAASHSIHQASVEVIDDEEDHVRHNAGHPKNPHSILEGTDDESDEEPALQEETDEQELSKATIHT